MLSKLCKELNNWDFNHRADKYFGAIVIADGRLVTYSDKLVKDQYFRIVGSKFNDGIYEYPATELVDEVFDGAIWAMYVPDEIIELAEEIKDWQKRYGGVDSQSMSPYQSESFGGYSYTKAGASASGGSGKANSWQGVFSARLNKWRKI